MRKCGIVGGINYFATGAGADGFSFGLGHKEASNNMLPTIYPDDHHHRRSEILLFLSNQYLLYAAATESTFSRLVIILWRILTAASDYCISLTNTCGIISNAANHVFNESLVAIKLLC